MDFLRMYSHLRLQWQRERGRFYMVSSSRAFCIVKIVASLTGWKREERNHEYSHLYIWQQEALSYMFVNIIRRGEVAHVLSLLGRFLHSVKSFKNAECALWIHLIVFMCPSNKYFMNLWDRIGILTRLNSQRTTDLSQTSHQTHLKVLFGFNFDKGTRQSVLLWYFTLSHRTPKPLIDNFVFMYYFVYDFS